MNVPFFLPGGYTVFSSSHTHFCMVPSKLPSPNTETNNDEEQDDKERVRENEEGRGSGRVEGIR